MYICNSSKTGLYELKEWCDYVPSSHVQLEISDLPVVGHQWRLRVNFDGKFLFLFEPDERLRAMTATPPSNTQSKQGIFSSIPGSSRRPSISSLTGYSPSLSSQGIGYSPSTPVSSASSGIPSFRSLRSLLPFGPNKNVTPVSISVSPNTSRSPFASFGSVRRSMTKERERKVSLSNDAIVPVIAIEKSNNDPFPDDTAIRRSVSLSTLDKPLPSEPSFEDSSSPFKGGDLLPSAFTLRTPSPGPPLSAELSTIIEADNSGASKQMTANNSPTRINKPTQLHDVLDNPTPECDIDASALDLSTTHLADQVRDAIREGDSLKRQWLNPDEAVIIIDGDEHPEVADATFNMDTVDRDLAALLSPQSVTKNTPPQTSPVPNKNSHGPATPNSPASPISRLPRARQASSFLPRLRPSNSPSTTPQLTVQASSPTTPKASPLTVVTGNDPTPPNSPPSPALPSTSTPTPSRRSLTLNHTTRLFTPSTSSSFSTPKAAKMFGKQYLYNSNNSATPNLATRALRQVMPSARTNEVPHDSNSSPSPSRLTVTLGRTSLDSRCNSVVTENGAIGLGRPSLEIRRGTSFDSRTRRGFNRSSTSPERTETEGDSSPSPDTQFEEYRPSLDSNTTTRPSFDSISRPDSAARLRDWDSQRTTPSLRVMDTTVRDRASPIPKITNPIARMRKRSMSVQERFGRGRVPPNENGAAIFSRPGSSLSGKAGRGGGAMLGLESGNESGSALGPKMEWLGPRTAKAFRAAGLLDFEREKERDREEGSEPTERLRGRSGSTSGVLSPSPLGIGNPGSTLNRFASVRSASEYNPIYGRSHSRLALSEAGTGGSGAPCRRGSESFSAYGASSYSGNGGGGGGGGGSSYGHNGLMESPTFTVSSGSRERDTPKSSTSTAPTSLADSFGYLGRDRSERDLNRERERDREREEMRDMKEKHGIEMGALLGALSDSQRTVRVLREENSDLRDRLERLTLAVQATEELRQACGDLENECTNLRRENTDLRRELRALKSSSNSMTNSLYSWSGGSSSGMRTPVPKTASPLARTFTPRVAQEKEEEYDETFIDHGSEVENHPHYSSTDDTEYTHDEHNTTSSEIILPPSSSTPSQKRRLSDSSSIFPTPPSNMTLLLHEDPTSTLGSMGGCNRSSADHSQYGFTSPPGSNSSQRKTEVRSLSQSPPISYRNFAGNIPNTTVGSISPTTANFSMVTGSPGSLFLRPEHEILLGDMESLDLGMQCGDGEVTDGKVDGW